MKVENVDNRQKISFCFENFALIHFFYSFIRTFFLLNKLVDEMKMLAHESEFRVKVAVRVS